MKKVFSVYFIIILLTSQICYTQETAPKKERKMTASNYIYTSEETKCEPCVDKNLIYLKTKDTLTIDEKTLLAALQQNCEICKAANLQASVLKEQNKLISYQTATIDNQPSAATPLWIMLILSIALFFYFK